MCLKKSKEKCGWSDMSNEKRVRDDSIEVTSVWVIGHFKDWFTLSEMGSQWVV